MQLLTLLIPRISAGGHRKTENVEAIPVTHNYTQQARQATRIGILENSQPESNPNQEYPTYKPHYNAFVRYRNRLMLGTYAKRIQTALSDLICFRIRVIENRMRHQEARMKSLSDTLSEVKEVLKGCESNVGAAYEASQMLIAFIEKMFPQEDTGLGEVGS